jgi:DNA polymerase-3 subunit chi
VTQVDFYHLAAPVERVLPRIAERVVEGGGRLLVVAGEAALLERLDQALWSYTPESFLPHGLAGQDGAAVQPVLLSDEAEPANGAHAVALADGVWRDAALSFDRAFHLFDEAGLVPARTAWKALAARDGVERRYWKQDEAGRWTQAA